MRLKVVVALCLVWILTACASPYKAPDLGGLYNSLVQNENPYRNPVILIPGLLGSKLIDQQTGRVAWGTFGVRNLGSGITAWPDLVNLVSVAPPKIVRPIDQHYLNLRQEMRHMLVAPGLVTA